MVKEEAFSFDADEGSTILYLFSPLIPSSHNIARIETRGYFSPSLRLEKDGRHPCLPTPAPCLPSLCPLDAAALSSRWLCPLRNLALSAERRQDALVSRACPSSRQAVQQRRKKEAWVSPLSACCLCTPRSIRSQDASALAQGNSYRLVHSQQRGHSGSVPVQQTPWTCTLRKAGFPLLMLSPLHAVVLTVSEGDKNSLPTALMRLDRQSTV